MLSLVIPAYNEARALPATLDALARQRGDREIIVVDGGSSDATRDIVRARPGVRLVQATKGRASQMNAGARAARGDWLLFLHADTALPAGILERFEAQCASLGCEAGAWRPRGFPRLRSLP
jgi:glycosyltransferase involved in cell wall biosynthesis